MANFATLGQLSSRLGILAKKIESNATDIVRGAANTVNTTVVVTTPVDTGLARSAWITKIGSEPTFVPKEPPSNPSLGATIALRQGSEEIKGWKAGDPDIYISNGLPYIQKLEDGSSRQAPQGMISQALVAGKDFVARQKLLKSGD